MCTGFDFSALIRSACSPPSLRPAAGPCACCIGRPSRCDCLSDIPGPSPSAGLVLSEDSRGVAWPTPVQASRILLWGKGCVRGGTLPRADLCCCPCVGSWVGPCDGSRGRPARRGSSGKAHCWFKSKVLAHSPRLSPSPHPPALPALPRPAMPLLADLQAPALLAVASHLVFANYEPSAAVVVALYVIGSATLLFLDPGETLLDTLRRLSIALSVYTGTLFASMAVYRLFLHRIRHIPGPRSLALSKWASVPVDLAGKRPVLIDGLHKQFGTLVRTGPREVSINDVKAVSAVLGANSACTKGPWYCAVQGGKGPRSLSLHATLEPSEHKARRRIWDAGFSVASLKAYTNELKDTNEKLMSQLEKYAQSGKEVHIDHWCQFFSFDIMGMLGFSRSFDLIGNGNFSRPIEVRRAVPWECRCTHIVALSCWRAQWR